MAPRCACRGCHACHRECPATKVSLAAFCEPEEIDGTEPELRAVCEESEVIPLHYARLSEGGDYLRRLRAIVSPSPFTIDRFRSDDMRLRLQRKANNRSFDVVICDNVYSAINLAAGVSPIVMNSQNVEYLILQRYAEQEKNPFKAMYARLEAAKVRRFEAAMYRRAVCAMTCSTVDAGLVRQLCPGIQVFIAPNVVDVRDYGLESEEEPFTIVYQGGIGLVPQPRRARVLCSTGLAAGAEASSARAADCRRTQSRAGV